MLIDWFTVAAQVINFLILMALLKYFLFDRVVRAMDRREAGIQERMNTAEEKERQARQKSDSLEQKQRQIEQERSKHLEDAKSEARELKNELERSARREIDEKRENWRRALQRDQAALADKLRRRAVEQFGEVARKALSDLADEDLESRMIEHFLQRLQGEQSQQLKAALRGAGEASLEAWVGSRFEIPAAMRSKITRAVHEHLDDRLAVEYETVDDLGGGIELRVAGTRFGWHLDGYLQSLTEETLKAVESVSGGGKKRQDPEEAKEADAS